MIDGFKVDVKSDLVEGEVYRLGRDELSLLFTDDMPMGHIGAVLGRY